LPGPWPSHFSETSGHGQPAGCAEDEKVLSIGHNSLLGFLFNLTHIAWVMVIPFFQKHRVMENPEVAQKMKKFDPSRSSVLLTMKVSHEN
jgi:hypothetical protein